MAAIAAGRIHSSRRDLGAGPHARPAVPRGLAARGRPDLDSRASRGTSPRACCGASARTSRAGWSAAFGDSVFDVIEREPARLRDVEGIGPLRATRIAEGWHAQRAVRDIMVFLHAHGVSTARAVRIYKTYGVDAIPVISENPYRLARDIRGIGFLTADRIAEKVGIAKTAMVRARAGIGYALAEALDDGHCGLPEPELVAAAGRLLQIPMRSRVARRSALELADGTVVRDTVEGAPCIFLAGLHAAERQIADDASRGLPSGRPPWPDIDAARAIPWVEARLGLELAPGQRDALTRALRSKVLVMTGGPGVGKTTLLNAMLRVLGREGRTRRPLRADGPRRQAPGRGDRARGEDHPSAARNQSARWPVPAERAAPARRRRSSSWTRRRWSTCRSWPRSCAPCRRRRRSCSSATSISCRRSGRDRCSAM